MTNREVFYARWIHDRLCVNGKLPILAILPEGSTDTLYDALSYNLGEYDKGKQVTWIDGTIVFSKDTIDCPYCKLEKGEVKCALGK